MNKSEVLVNLEDGKPLIFANGEKGVRMNGFKPEVISLTSGEFSESDLYIHHDNEESDTQAFIYGIMTESPELPTPLGVFRQISASTFEARVAEKAKLAVEKNGKGDIYSLLHSGNTWEVE